MEKNKRIEFIDLAKGVCIILVMSVHLNNNNILASPYFLTFRMPFYFFICGLFFSSKYDFKIFVKKKINALLIPFIAFELIYIFYSLLLSFFLDSFSITKIFTKLISPYRCVNGPLWFLICLFNSYIIFYAISKLKVHQYYQFIVILFISMVGFYSSKCYLWGHRIVFPFFLSTSMTSLIFIYLGYWSRKYADILNRKRFDSLILISSIIIFCLIQIYYGPNHIHMNWNTYSYGYIGTVFAAITGIISIIYICKFLQKVPIVSFIGRYSLITLGTHYMLLPLISFIDIEPNISLLVLILLECPVIIIFKNYFPSICALKPFYK